MVTGPHRANHQSRHSFSYEKTDCCLARGHGNGRPRTNRAASGGAGIAPNQPGLALQPVIRPLTNTFGAAATNAPFFPTLSNGFPGPNNPFITPLSNRFVTPLSNRFTTPLSNRFTPFTNRYANRLTNKFGNLTNRFPTLTRGVVVPVSTNPPGLGTPTNP